MRRLRASWPHQALCVAAILVMNGLATGQARYVVTNDDPGVSFYTDTWNGVLTLKQQIHTGFGNGNVGGFFGTNRIMALDSGNQGCVYASEASTGDIVGFSSAR